MTGLEYIISSAAMLRVLSPVAPAVLDARRVDFVLLGVRRHAPFLVISILLSFMSSSPAEAADPDDIVAGESFSFCRALRAGPTLEVTALSGLVSLEPGATARGRPATGVVSSVRCGKPLEYDDPDVLMLTMLLSRSIAIDRLVIGGVCVAVCAAGGGFIAEAGTSPSLSSRRDDLGNGD